MDTIAPRVWVRFEGPGRLQARRWHIVRHRVLGQRATWCGIPVIAAEPQEEAGDGPQCKNCRNAFDRGIHHH